MSITKISESRGVEAEVYRSWRISANLKIIIRNVIIQQYLLLVCRHTCISLLCPPGKFITLCFLNSESRTTSSTNCIGEISTSTSRTSSPEYSKLQIYHFNPNLTISSGSITTSTFRLGKMEKLGSRLSTQLWGNSTPLDSCITGAGWLWLLSWLRIYS